MSLLFVDLLLLVAAPLLLMRASAEQLRTVALPARPASGGFSRTSRWIYSGSRGGRHVAHSVVPSQTGTYFERWASTRVSGMT